MRNSVIIFLAVLLSGASLAFSQDNIYGDYLLAGYDKTISLDLEDAHLVDVLKMLSQQSEMNFISTEAVQDRKLTLYLDNVPLREALDIIFKANHLAYDFYPETNMFVVKEMGKPDLELKTKVYHLRYVRVQNSRMQEDIDALVEVQTQATTGTQGAGQGDTTGGDITTTEEEGEGIKAAVESVLTEFGKVTADPETNSLTVVDVPSRFPMIDEVVNQLDVPLPTVMIEVEMLDVSKNTADLLGVKWPNTLVNLGVAGTKWTHFPFPKNKTIDPDSFTWDADQGILLDNWEFTDFPGGKFTPSVLTVLGADLALQFLRTQADTRFLARPKILTVSNETAQVNITTNETIGGTLTTNISGTGQQAFTPERAETGTSLRVTPQVDQTTGQITLFVEIAVREAKTSTFAFESDVGITGTLKDPEERKASAVVRLSEGQTLFMGGLINSKDSDVVTKVPLLGDIPIIGRAFRHRNKQQQERELMVFITPRLVRGGALPTQQARADMVRREQGDASLRHRSVKLALDAFNK